MKAFKQWWKDMEPVFYGFVAHTGLILAFLVLSALLAVLSGVGDLLKYWTAWQIVFR